MVTIGEFWMCHTGYLASFDLGHGIWLSVPEKQEPLHKDPHSIFLQPHKQNRQAQAEVTIKITPYIADLKPEPGFLHMLVTQGLEILGVSEWEGKLMFLLEASTFEENWLLSYFNKYDSYEVGVKFTSIWKKSWEILFVVVSFAFYN